MTTTQRGVLVHQRTMYSCYVAHLVTDIRVTGDTTIRHRRRLPRRDMTGSAIASCFRMGCNAAQCADALGAQGSRVIHQAAARVGIAHDQARGDQRRENTDRRQAAKSSILHRPSHSVFPGLHIHPYQNLQQASRPVHVAPVGGRVACSAIVPVFSIVLVFMTGNTLCGCALVSVRMAFLAFQFGMLPHQWKCSIVVIEGRIAPAIRAVTGTAVDAKLAVMLVIVCMTGITVCGCAFVPICMTCLALEIRVPAGQRECSVVVIEGHVLPGRGLVTRSTLRSKLAAVCIVIGMAGIAVLRRALIDSVHMTGSALHICMTATQGKGGVVVVKRHVLPAARVMAGSTICAKLPIVLIIADMTGIAILRCALEGSICVTSRTLNIHMASAQWKVCIVMIKSNFLPTCGVMTGSTIRAELPIVLIIADMTGIAILRGAFQDSIRMASRTLDIGVTAS